MPNRSGSIIATMILKLLGVRTDADISKSEAAIAQQIAQEIKRDLETQLTQAASNQQLGSLKTDSTSVIFDEDRKKV